MEPLPLTGLDPGEELAFTRAVMRHFHEDADSDAALEPWARGLPVDRALAVRDRDAIVANFLVVPTDISVPGGGRLPCAAVTAVGVAQTHRRRGLLRRMMTAGLDRAVAEGEPVAALYASETAIYPRFGFGPSAPSHALRAEVREVRFRDPVDDALVRAATPSEAITTARAVYDRVRSERPGGVGRGTEGWRIHLEDDPVAWRDGATARRLVHVPDRGYATYRIVERYDDDALPAGEVRIEELVASDVEAEQALWQHVLGIDLCRTALAAHRPVDDALPWLVVDPLRLRPRVAYPMYTRLLDVASCLAARTSAHHGEVTLHVVDDSRDQTGTYRWEGGPDGGRCRRVAEVTPDLSLSVQTLAALWLGGATAIQLHRGRRIDEHATGAVARLDGLLATPLAPWTPWEF